MSTLIVENINSSGVVTTTTISNGSGDNINVSDISNKLEGATAWCRFDSTGSGQILQSYNVNGIVDINTGRWNVQFTVPMVDDEYVALGSASSGTNTSTDTWINPYSFTLNGCSFGTYNAAGEFTDRSVMCVAFFGSKS